MFKYKDKVLIIKDPENDGFFEGTEGIVMTKEFEESLKERLGISEVDKSKIRYGVDIGHYRGFCYCKEDELQKI